MAKKQIVFDKTMHPYISADSSTFNAPALWLVISFCLYAMARETLVCGGLWFVVCEAIIFMFVSDKLLFDLSYNHQIRIHLFPF